MKALASFPKQFFKIEMETHFNMAQTLQYLILTTKDWNHVLFSGLV